MPERVKTVSNGEGYSSLRYSMKDDRNIPILTNQPFGKIYFIVALRSIRHPDNKADQILRSWQ